MEWIPIARPPRPSRPFHLQNYSTLQEAGQEFHFNPTASALTSIIPQWNLNQESIWPALCQLQQLALLARSQLQQPPQQPCLASQGQPVKARLPAGLVLTWAQQQQIWDLIILPLLNGFNRLSKLNSTTITTQTTHHPVMMNRWNASRVLTALEAGLARTMLHFKSKIFQFLF